MPHELSTTSGPAEQPQRQHVDQDRARGPVLVVTHLFPTSVRDIRGPWVAEQVDALAELIDIRVLCCSHLATDRSETRPSGVLVTYRATGTALGVGHLGLLASSIRYHRALGRYLRSEPSTSLIHAHFGFPDAIVAFQHTRGTGRPLVVTMHGGDAFRVLLRRDPIGRAVRRAVAGARAVICVSDAVADAVRAVLPQVEPVVISNGYDDRLFRRTDAGRDLGLLFVGTLVPVKNLPILLRAYASVRDRISAQLTLAGDGKQRTALEELAAELGVPDRVRFVGALTREEVAALMQRAVALVLPSRSEGWPLVIGEALACGTPVVASRVGGIPEIVGSGDGGILVAPGDEAGLAEALVAILERHHDPARVAAASRAQPWSVQARSIAAVYDQALGGSLQGRRPGPRDDTVSRFGGSGRGP